jgi:hypothetical protein
MTGSAGAMARQWCAALVAPLVLFVLAGCSDAPGETDGRDPANPLLYEIASADGTVEGWMFGTIHALPDGVAWRTPAIGRVIDAADLLVVEVGELTGRDEGPSIYFSLAQSPGLPPLDQRVPAALRGELSALMERGNRDPHELATYETWAAALSLARIDAAGDPGNGVDAALIDELSGKRPIRELEGMRGQLSIFDRLPEPQQRIMLAAVVQESEAARKDPERLQRAWLAGDAATIEASTREGILAEPVLREALLTGRNRRWVDALVPLLESGPRPLVAVGSAHLVGPEGLAALLEARGYRVRRIGAPRP